MTQPPARKMPPGLVLEQPRFAPRLVLTSALKTLLREVVHQWRHREAFENLIKFGIRPLDRLLFFGPPGNGKTLCCYYLSQELQVPLYRVLCNQLHGRALGDTTRAVADVMEFLNGLTTPAICLFDEAESIFVDRSRSVGECDREIAAALTIFMQAIDRWKAPTLLVLATNLVGQLDQALMSRIELQIEFTGPTREQTNELVNYWAEMLCDNGGSEWGPKLRDRLAEESPASFRQIQQIVAWTARDWTAGRIA